MKTYISHKRVQAAMIVVVGSYRTNENGELVRPLRLDDDTTVEAPDIMFVRYVPVPGDYYVVYEDGYRSFSPRDQFLKGYTADGPSFADIKQGLKVPNIQAGTNFGDGVALSTAAHPADPKHAKE